MSDWTAGYLTDVGYTYGYYTELNPLRVRLAFLHSRLKFPEIGAACELGFGQGLSVNIHAAASQTQWFGTDFNPSQAWFAQDLAAISGSGAQLYDQAFAEFCNSTDLPDFEYIGIHGIWSWISDENRAVIIDFIRRKLKVGGVLYISYNTQPGWAAMVPLRDLLTEHYEVMGTAGQGIVSRIDGALAFVDKLFSVNPAYASANPQVTERIKNMKEHDRNYLAHEYFNRDWHPMPFSRLAEWLAPTKLSYACSAHYLDQINAVNLTAEQLALLAELPDAMFRETVRDFMVNQQFRRDYWVKGLRTIAAHELDDSVRAQQLILAQPRDKVMLKINSSRGVVTMQEAIYGPILDCLADHQSRTLGQLEQSLKESGIHFYQLLEAVMILAGNGTLLATQNEAAASKAGDKTKKLNACLLNKARNSGAISGLASPVTGGGIAVGRFQQLFLLASSQGKTKPADWAEYAWQVLASQNQRILKDGRPLESETDNVAELNEQAKEFADQQLPILENLGVV